MNKICFLLLVVLGFGCNKKSTLSVVPKITFNSMQPQIVNAGASMGGTLISLYVEDGDGDIGFGTNNLYFKDSRDSNVVVFRIPEVPTEYSPEGGISGTIDIAYLSALLTLRPDTAHFTSDTLYWEIYMKDLAGNVSNTVVSDTLYLFK